MILLNQMTTQSLKLKTNIINNSDLQRRIFRSMIYSISFLCLCYVLILGNMVYNIIARKNIETQSRSLSTEVSTLELHYLALSGKVDLKMAYTMGFKETNKSFAKRQNSLGSIIVAKNEL